uniref:Capsid protein n=1 Tax=Giant panda anellovirus TaxID=2016460 RepID=A0A220IGI2_9VIRU|nr:ORF1 [Giant panda anellovirus]
MYYRRRPYRRRRHFLHHRKRRYRRLWRRAHRRRGYYRRRRVSTIKQVNPRRRRLLVCTGWEILGQIGSQLKYTIKSDGKPQIDVLNPIPANKQVTYLSQMVPQGLENKCSDTWVMNIRDPSGMANKKGPTHWDFCGGWGYAKFDFQSLILRNLLGMNRFSESILTFTHIRFLKFKVQLVRGPSLDYLFRLQMHRGPQDWESPLIHPSHLINMPFVTWVESTKRSKCCRMKTLRRIATTDLSGWYDIESFRALELFSYQWTVFDPNNPLGKNPIIPKSNKKWWNDDWMRAMAGENKKISENRHLNWQDRTTYDQGFVKTIDPKKLNATQNFWDWVFTGFDTKNTAGKTTPFLPPIMPSEYVNTFWFRYKIYFQIGGQTISRNAPPWPLRETTDNTGKCMVTNCPYCIKEGDLDDTGQLKEKALERITEPPERRKKKLVEKLARALQQRRKRNRRHITWWDEGKAEEHVSTTHTRPKNFKNKCLRRLAERLGL